MCVAFPRMYAAFAVLLFFFIFLHHFVPPPPPHRRPSGEAAITPSGPEVHSPVTDPEKGQ